LKWEPSGVGALKGDVRSLIRRALPSRVNHCTAGINTRHNSTALRKCEGKSAIAAANVKNRLAENITRQPQNHSPLHSRRRSVDS
jgi:hypothetical protein